MTASSEKLAKITRQIQALMLKTVESGASEAEALSAAEKVQELMNLYDLSMSDIEINTQEFVANDIQTKKSTVSAVHNMINAISEFTDTKAWFIRYRSREIGIQYHFFGAKKDVEFAHFLFKMFANAIEFESKKYQKSVIYKRDLTGGKAKMNSFKIGMTSRLNQRLREIKAQRQHSNQEMGLVLYNKMALTNEKYQEMIGGYELCTCSKNKERKSPLMYKDCCGKLKIEKNTKRVGSYTSYTNGYKAGDNVNITTALGGTTTKKELMGR